MGWIGRLELHVDLPGLDLTPSVVAEEHQIDPIVMLDAFDGAATAQDLALNMVDTEVCNDVLAHAAFLGQDTPPRGNGLLSEATTGQPTVPVA